MKIARGEAWQKGKFATTLISEAEVVPWSTYASCWCIRGAVYSVAGNWVSKDAAQAMMFLEEILERETGWPAHLLANWNDHPDTTHNDVIGLLDRAIAEAPDD